MADTNNQLSLFDTEVELPFLFYTSIERDGQGFASPMSQMRAKRYCRVSFDSVNFNIYTEDAKKMHSILIAGFNNGISFSETFHGLLK
jgi:hypothetical protein